MRNNNHIDKHTLAYLDPSSQKCYVPTMYFLPKIHKTPPTGTPFVGRPIINGCSSPTAKISEFVDHFLLPIPENTCTCTCTCTCITNIIIIFVAQIITARLNVKQHLFRIVSATKVVNFRMGCRVTYISEAKSQ